MGGGCGAEGSWTAGRPPQYAGFQRAAEAQYVGEVSVNRKSYSFVILASERCSDYLCDFAATGFVLDPSGDSVPGSVYCERCGRKMVAEYCEKVEPGWTFHPGKIHGDLRARPPAPPEAPATASTTARAGEKDDCSFLDHVEAVLTSQPRTHE